MSMESRRLARAYLVGAATYWLIFGLITTFYPKLMDLFQTPEGVAAKTVFSDHVWFHGGLDIIAFSIVLLFLSRENVSARMLRGTGLAALMPVLAIGFSYAATPFWKPVFLVAGAGCLGFALWGFSLARRVERDAEAVLTSPAPV
jgi:hypothetical protein